MTAAAEPLCDRVTVGRYQSGTVALDDLMHADKVTVQVLETHDPGSE